MRRVRLVLLSIVLVAVFSSSGQALAASDIVVSQVYGGGGNTGATLKNDFIELFNRGTSTVNVTGWSVQYTSAAGSSWAVTALSGSIQPGRYYLVKQAAGAGGTVDLPAPDATGSSMMSATAGKVALVNTTAALAGTCPTAIDFVGYGAAANCFEGSGPAPAPSNTTADLRGPPPGTGCQDTDNNSTDFATGTPNPRNSATPAAPCSAEQAPFVAATDPANGATGVSTDSSVTITFSEPVTVSATTFTIACAASGTHSFALSGGPTAYVLNPDADFAQGESCTVTTAAGGVSDVDDVDPPDQMAADHSFSFSTAALTGLRIHDLQGAQHRSPYDGRFVAGVPGVVTALRSNGFYYQDPMADGSVATSEAIFVFTGGAPSAAVGNSVLVEGQVTEFRPGCSPTCDPTNSAFANLTTTEIVNPTVTVVEQIAPLPPSTTVGQSGRVPPTMVIDDDATGSVETSGTFDAAADGIDFYESLEAMLVRINNALAVGPTSDFGEIPVVGDRGARASLQTNRGGVVIRPNDFNPERIQLDDAIAPNPPALNVRDRFTAPVVGVLDYSFGNFKLLPSEWPATASGGLTRETTSRQRGGELAVATFNVENLDPTDPPAKFAALANLIVNHLRSPDLLALEEVQDNNGPANDATTDGSVTFAMLIAAIEAAGGPAYDFRQIDPEDDQDGGESGGNIRVGFLFRTDRGLAFVDRPGGASTTPNEVDAGPGGNPQLRFSPGRIDPANPAFTDSRKPLAGEFRFRGETLFVVANHFNSKGGDHPLFGRFQPPVRATEVQRHQQAQIVNDFVDDILALDRRANVVVLGDLNDFEFSETLELVRVGVLRNLIDTLQRAERYTFVFEGNSQVLDHILVSRALFGEGDDDDDGGPRFDVVHVNAEFADQQSDHDPSVARLRVGGDDG